MTQDFLRIAGLMSGTSMDGVDAALLTSNGEDVAALGATLTMPYPQNLRKELQKIIEELSDWSQTPDFHFDRRWILRQSEEFTARLHALERDLTLSHAECLQQLLVQSQAKKSPEDQKKSLGKYKLDLIGFHGHTILHHPARRFTWQLGDGTLLSEIMQTPVIYDFRSQDVAAGGEGAPLVPIYHRARVQAANLPRPIAVVNIGGVANITWIGQDAQEATPLILAFDTGPGVALLDDFAQTYFGVEFDQGGAVASQGRVIETLLKELCDHPWFHRSPPKSLDRNAWRRFIAELMPPTLFTTQTMAEGSGRFPDGSLEAIPEIIPEIIQEAQHRKRPFFSAADGAATLAAFTARAIALALRHVPEPPKQILLAGGGRRHKMLMTRIAAEIAAIDATIECRDIDQLGWDGDGFEAEAFAFLAVRSYYHMPISFPSTTKVPHPLCGGVLVRPESK
ncbi:MAG: anhydro-N-acetylmuramic acid kinase [Alphaproteobacteria bacterium]|nr:anhydro-N-acetylmuramic acid kinase [Alphaproteobacteria bacterium]